MSTTLVAAAHSVNTQMWDWFVSNVGDSDITPFEACFLLFGIFAGGATVGYTSALFRLRTETRKELWDDLPEFRSRLHDHAGELRVRPGTESSSKTVESASESIEAWLEDFHQHSRRVSFLSWVERLAWFRLSRQSLKVQAWYDLQWLTWHIGTDDSPMGPEELDDRATKALHEALIADADLLRLSIRDRPAPLRDFREHVHRKLRVGHFRRLQSTRYALGVTWFFVKISPQVVSDWRKLHKRRKAMNW